jgi:hypothetical protein
VQRKPNISNRAKVSLFFKLHWPAVVVGVVEMMQRKKRDLLSTWFKSSRNSFKRDPHRRRLMAFFYFLKIEKRIEGSHKSTDKRGGSLLISKVSKLSTVKRE